MKVLYFSIFLVLCSCGSLKDKNIFPIQNELLVNWKSEFISPDGVEIDEKYGSTQEFEKENLQITYLKDTILAEAVISVNACGKAIADIVFLRDTLLLTTIETSQLLCNSIDWYKFQYWIYNPDNKRFVLIQN